MEHGRTQPQISRRQASPSSFCSHKSRPERCPCGAFPSMGRPRLRQNRALPQAPPGHSPKPLRLLGRPSRRPGSPTHRTTQSGGQSLSVVSCCGGGAAGATAGDSIGAEVSEGNTLAPDIGRGVSNRNSGAIHNARGGRHRRANLFYRANQVCHMLRSRYLFEEEVLDNSVTYQGCNFTGDRTTGATDVPESS